MVERKTAHQGIVITLRSVKYSKSLLPDSEETTFVVSGPKTSRKIILKDCNRFQINCQFPNGWVTSELNRELFLTLSFNNYSERWKTD